MYPCICSWDPSSGSFNLTGPCNPPSVAPGASVTLNVPSSLPETYYVFIEFGGYQFNAVTCELAKSPVLVIGCDCTSIQNKWNIIQIDQSSPSITMSVHDWFPSNYYCYLPNVPNPRLCGTPPTMLTAGTGLLSGGSITSTDGRFKLILQYDGNLVLYYGNSALWASCTNGKNSYGVVMQADGNLVISDINGKALWATGTCCNPPHPNAYLALQNDGNLVIYDFNDSPIWASNTQNGKISNTFCH